MPNTQDLTISRAADLTPETGACRLGEPDDMDTLNVGTNPQ